MKLVPSVPEYADDTAAIALWERFRVALEPIEGIAYYRHPIISSSTNIPPDFTLLAKSFEPVTVRVLRNQLDELKRLDRDAWMVHSNLVDSPVLDLDDFLVGLTSRFDKQRPLRGVFRPIGVLAFALITRAQFIAAFPNFESELYQDNDRFVLLFKDDPVERILRVCSKMNAEQWPLAMSVFQGVHPLNRARHPGGQSASTMGEAIKLLNQQIALLDDEQHLVATQIAPGPQRIRGLAGTGKTVILAMKAANIHLHYPDAKILFTFNTQSLYQQIERLISQFYRVNGDVAPNWEVLHVRHGWGSLRRPGVYSDLCRRIGVGTLSFAEAKRRNSDAPFAAVCRDLLGAAVPQEYDYILVDEAQDFPPEYFKVLGKLAREPKRIYFAYDEMQSLTSIDVPDPKSLFGVRDDGSAIVDLDGDPYPGEIDRDFVLHRSYRCPRDILLIAHAIGLGIHAPGGCVQMLGARASWEAVGYNVDEGEFRAGDNMVLSRSLENSPNKIKQIYTGTEQVITLERRSTKLEELAAVAERIRLDISVENVSPSDIVVICLDNRMAKKHFQSLQRLLYDANIDSTIPGLVDDSWEFTQEGAVTLSTIFRAKGNEAPVVHLFGFEALYGYAEEVENRNRAFTSISRSKGWLRIYGSGITMGLAEAELQRIVDDLPALKFKFPDLEDVARKLDSAETSRRRSVVSKLKRGVEQILAADEAALRDIDDEQRRRLIERLSEGYE